MQLRDLLVPALVLSTLPGCYYYRERAPQPAEPPPAYAEAPGAEQQPPVAEGPEAPPEEAPRRHHRRAAAVQELAPRIHAPIAFGNGEAGAFRGLVYLVPDDQDRVPDFSRLKPIATLFTDSFDVRPQEFRGGFPGISKEDEWFAIHYEGQFNADEPGPWQFRLVSDDGAVLYIDGKKIIDNDGVHGVRAARGTAMLNPGPHSLRLDYFQGNRGPAALGLFAAAPSAPGREFILQGNRR